MMEKFKYLGKLLANQYSIQKEIKSWWKSGNACYDSVQNLLFSSSLFKNVKVKTNKTVIFPTLL
jgi:hypothetical protein